MANFRPAGLSDDDSESDDYGGGGVVRPSWHHQAYQQHNLRKKIEMDLQEAILVGNVSGVEKIVHCDLNKMVNMKLDSGWTALMHACFHAQDKIVSFLLDLGADPNLHADSLTPIMAACSNSSANSETIHNIIVNLIEKGSILNIGDKYGQTPLMRAISSGRKEVVQKMLDCNANIEMRDQQGWTAAFWAVHHNQPSILEMLIERGARLTEVDKSSRTLMDIANSHEYDNIIEILNGHQKVEPKVEDPEKATYLAKQQLKSWQDYYPGLYKGKTVNYTGEIPQLLYGMNCERLGPIIDRNNIDLRTFLLLEEEDMVKLGIDMPYERRRLQVGLRNFHLRGWKLGSVSGLYARKNENYNVLDCLTTLGTHLQQVYILEATLQYALRDYARLQSRIKFEPPDSPLLVKLKTTAKRVLLNINSIRKESKTMKKILTKVSGQNPKPADLIREKTTREIALGYASEVILICSLSFLVYHAKNLVTHIASGCTAKM